MKSIIIRPILYFCEICPRSIIAWHKKFRYLVHIHLIGDELKLFFLCLIIQKTYWNFLMESGLIDSDFFQTITDYVSEESSYFFKNPWWILQLNHVPFDITTEDCMLSFCLCKHLVCTYGSEIHGVLCWILAKQLGFS